MPRDPVTGRWIEPVVVLHREFKPNVALIRESFARQEKEMGHKPPKPRKNPEPTEIKRNEKLEKVIALVDSTTSKMTPRERYEFLVELRYLTLMRSDATMKEIREKEKG